MTSFSRCALLALALAGCHPAWSASMLQVLNVTASPYILKPINRPRNATVQTFTSQGASGHPKPYWKNNQEILVAPGEKIDAGVNRVQPGRELKEPSARPWAACASLDPEGRVLTLDPAEDGAGSTKAPFDPDAFLF